MSAQTDTQRRKYAWGCLIASGLLSLIGLSVLCAALLLLFPPSWLRRAAAGPGLLGASGNAPAETAMNAPTSRAATATLAATPTLNPTPTASATPQPPPPPPDVEGPLAPAIDGPTNHLRIPCEVPLSVSLRWEAASDPSGIDSYRVRLAKYGPDSTEEQLFDRLPAAQLNLTVTMSCGTSYGWNVLARDGAGNQGAASAWAYFDVDSATSVPTILSPKDYKHLSCVAQIILRWEAVDDPDGISGYMVELQEVLGEDHGESQQFGWMVPTQYDASRRTDCGRTYRWRVSASDQLLSQGKWSGWAYFIINAPG